MKPSSWNAVEIRKIMSRAIPSLAVASVIFGVVACEGALPFFGGDPPLPDELPPETIEAESRQASRLTDAHDTVSRNRQQWNVLTREGRNHLRLGSLAEAEESFMGALEIAHGFRHGDIRRDVSVGNLESLAGAYQVSDQLASFARVAAVVAQETVDETELDRPGLSEFLYELALHQLSLGDDEAARATLVRALELRTEKEGLEALTLVPIYSALAQTESSLGDHEAAAANAEKALVILDANQGDDDPRMIAILIQLASARSELGQESEAEALLLRALENERKLSPQSLGVAVILNDLANVYLVQGDPKKALDTVDESLGLLDSLNIRGIYRANIADTRANALAALGRTKEAEAAFAEALADSETATPPQRRLLLESYAEHLRHQGRNQRLAEIRAEIEALGGEPEPAAQEGSAARGETVSTEPEAATSRGDSAGAEPMNSEPPVQAQWDEADDESSPPATD